MNIANIGMNCCGCRNCETVCPNGAITFKKNEWGFLYPQINESCCVNCGRCYVVCPAANDIPKESKVFLSGMAYALDERTKFEGSSGGLFGVFAKEIIKNGGIVFGAAFDQQLRLKTTPAETEEQLTPLYKSKYLLCDTNRQFEKIRCELESGRWVLYCSTPCQIYALKLFLQKEYKNLITVEFVCHGVGSQDLFDKSISYSEKTLNAKISKVIFRYKVKNASSHYYYYYCENLHKSFEIKDLYLTFPFYNAYEKGLAYRDSCYDCKFATKYRNADITISDFHTVDKFNPDVDRFAGVSMFLCNTEKGNGLFSEVKDQLFVQEISPDELYPENRFSGGENIPKRRMPFLESLKTDSFAETCKKFLHPYKDRIWLIYYHLPSCLRKLVRRLSMIGR